MIRQLALRYLPREVDTETIQLVPPKQGIAKGRIGIGKALYPGVDGVDVGIRISEFQKHVCIVGTTGSGKTTLAFRIVKQLVEGRYPVWVVDWKRSYRSLKKVVGGNSIKVFTIGRDVSPFDWNPLLPPPGSDPQSWYAIVCETLERSHVSGQGVADVVLEHIERLRSLKEPSQVTLQDVKQSVERVKYPGRKGLWQQSSIRILRSFTYGEGPRRAFNSSNPIRLEKLLTQNVVFELDMSMPMNLRTFLMDILVRWIHLYRLSQGETKNLRHVLLLEECHNLAGTGKDLESGLESVFRELRSFGQGAIAITQHPSVLPIWMLGNVHTLIAFSLSHQLDIEAARRAFFLSYDEARFFDCLRTGEAIAKVKDRFGATHVGVPNFEVTGGRLGNGEVKKNAEEDLD